MGWDGCRLGHLFTTVSCHCIRDKIGICIVEGRGHSRTGKERLRSIAVVGGGIDKLMIC